jgi:hypothetical protein
MSTKRCKDQVYYVETRRITGVTPSKPNFQHTIHSGAVVMFLITQYFILVTVMVMLIMMSEGLV